MKKFIYLNYLKSDIYFNENVVTPFRFFCKVTF